MRLIASASTCRISSDSNASTGSWPPPAIVSPTVAPLPRSAPARQQLVERDDADEADLAEQRVPSSSSVTPSSAATSLSSGLRRSSFSSFEYARSIERALARTERGTQSIERSSSMIAPLMRRDRVGLELVAAAGIELVDRVDEPEDAVADEVGLLDVLRADRRRRGRRRTSRAASSAGSGARARPPCCRSL